MGVTPQVAKVTIFESFTDFSLGYIEDFFSLLKCSSNFMKCHTIISKTLSEPIITVILHFGVKNVVLYKNNFISQKYWSFIETAVFGTKNFLWEFEIDQIICLDFTCVGSLK